MTADYRAGHKRMPLGQGGGCPESEFAWDSDRSGPCSSGCHIGWVALGGCEHLCLLVNWTLSLSLFSLLCFICPANHFSIKLSDRSALFQVVKEAQPSVSIVNDVGCKIFAHAFFFLRVRQFPFYKIFSYCILIEIF